MKKINSFYYLMEDIGTYCPEPIPEDQIKRIMEWIEDKIIGQNESGWSDYMGEWHGLANDTQVAQNNLREKQRNRLRFLEVSKVKGQKKIYCDNCGKEIIGNTGARLWDDDNGEVHDLCDKCYKSNK